MLLPINSFTIHNLVGFIITASLAVAFYVVYWKLGRKKLDLLTANFIACAAGMCAATFWSDNLVPAGLSSYGWKGGPTASELSQATLSVHRLVWLFGVLMMPAQLHFVLAYCGSRNILARRIRWVYILTFLTIPWIWTSVWLEPVTRPMAETSSWEYAIPWLPLTKWPFWPYITFVLSLGILSVVMLLRYRGDSQNAYYDYSSQRRLVLLAFVVQTLAIILDLMSVVVGYYGVSLVPVGTTFMGVLLAVALIQARVRSYRHRMRLEGEKEALLAGVSHPLFCVDTKLNVHWVNKPAADVLGGSVDELVGMSAREVLGTQSYPAYDLLKQVLRTAVPQQSEITREEDGSVWMVCASPILGQKDELLGAVEIATDITPIRKAEEALHSANMKILAAREEERHHVAKDLHDTIAQGMVALQMSLSAQARRSTTGTESAEVLTIAGQRCRNLVREIRHICYQLYPAALEVLGLSGAINDLLEPYRTAGKECRFQCDKSLKQTRLAGEMEIALFRVVQEAVSNAFRHGLATAVDVSLERIEGELVLSVRDNGSGFNVDNVSAHGIGINSMKGRVDSIGGQMRMHSSGKGTIVVVSVELEQEQGPVRQNA